MAKFIVVTTNPQDGSTFWLRSTTWAFSRERAQQFDSPEAAQAALDKSKQFNKAWAAKRAVIEELADA